MAETRKQSYQTSDLEGKLLLQVSFLASNDP